ncbi:MAG: hypothetical protein AB7O89_06080 [Parachlamydiales bacterium]
MSSTARRPNGLSCAAILLCDLQFSTKVSSPALHCEGSPDLLVSPQPSAACCARAPSSQPRLLHQLCTLKVHWTFFVSLQPARTSSRLGGSQLASTRRVNLENIDIQQID